MGTTAALDKRCHQWRRPETTRVPDGVIPGNSSAWGGSRALGVEALGVEALGAEALGAAALGAVALGALVLATRSCGEEEEEGIWASFS